MTLSEAPRQKASLLEMLCHQQAPLTSSNAMFPWELPCIFPSSICQPCPTSPCSWEQGQGSKALQKLATKTAEPILSWEGQPQSLGSIPCIPWEGTGVQWGHTIRRASKGIKDMDRQSRFQ